MSEEKMSLKIYLWREYASEENMLLKRNTGSGLRP
jgi:hypothetical protein